MHTFGALRIIFKPDLGPEAIGIRLQLVFNGCAGRKVIRMEQLRAIICAKAQPFSTYLS
jgi:hypothetical protein